MADDRSNLKCPLCGTVNPVLRIEHNSKVGRNQVRKSRVVCQSCVSVLGYANCWNWHDSDDAAMEEWLGVAIPKRSGKAEPNVDDIMEFEDQLMERLIDMHRSQFQNLVDKGVVREFKIDSVTITKVPGSKARAHVCLSFVPVICVDVVPDIVISKDGY